jgi:hypothetical protein
VQVVVTTTKGSSPTSTIVPAYQGPITIGPLEVFVPPAGCGCETAPAPTEFDYAAAPSISSVSPTYGSAFGGTEETITGSRFNLLTYEWTNFGPAADATSQDFNLAGVTADAVQVIDPPSFGAVAAEPVPTAVSVQAATGLGSYKGFGFAGVPVVDSLSSFSGPTTGGQSLTIEGAGFQDATQVDFLSQFEPGFFGASVVYLPAPPPDDSALTIVTPADLPTVTDVEVCSVTACDPADPAVDTYVFDYPGQPVVTSSAPGQGPAMGGTVVTIRGSLLAGTRAVLFGTQPAEGWSNGPGLLPTGSSTRVFAIAPPGQAGTKVEITVETLGSPRPSIASPQATFTYTPSAPSAPTSLHVTPLGGEAALTWSAPASDGGDAVTSYLAVASSPGRAPISAALPAATRSYAFSYLQPGVPWTFRVDAISPLGSGPPATSSAYVLQLGDNGYLVASTAGGVLGFGSLSSSGGVSTRLAHPVVGIAATPDGLGYWVLEANGLVYNFGDAAGFAQVGTPAGAKMVAITATPDGRGYWLVANDGAVFALGDARYRGGAGRSR